MESLTEFVDTLNAKMDNLKEQVFTVEERLKWAKELADKRAGQLAETTLKLMATEEQLVSKIKSEKRWKSTALIAGGLAVLEGAVIWFLVR